MFQISTLFGEIMESGMPRKSGDLMKTNNNNQKNTAVHPRNNNNKDECARKSTDDLSQPDLFKNNDLTDISLDIFAHAIPPKDAFVNKEYEAGMELDDDTMDDILCQAVDAMDEQINRNKDQSEDVISSPVPPDEEKHLEVTSSTENDSELLPCGQKIVDEKSQALVNPSVDEMSSCLNSIRSLFSQCGADINLGEPGMVSGFLGMEMQQNAEEDSLHESSDENEQSQLVFSHAFKKKVVMYATKHLSKTKASRRYGIPFDTVGVWIKKINKGFSESRIEWPHEPEPDEEYMQRFKTAVVEYVRKRRCSLEFAAEDFGLDSELIRCWRDDANKVRRESVISNIVSPVILENLGLALEDIKRKRKIECVDNPKDFSDDFILTVVRYIRRRKCAIDRASKMLEIDADVLRSWLRTDRYNQKRKVKPTNDGQLDIVSARRKSAKVDSHRQNVSESSSQDSGWFNSINPRPLSQLFKRNPSHIPDDDRREKHRLMASQYRNFHYFKGTVIDHVRKSRCSSATATHFDIPICTVYAWAKHAGIQLKEEPRHDEIYSEDFVESVRTFIKRRKCSSKYAGNLFHIDPDLITSWRKQATYTSVRRNKTRDRARKQRSRDANNLSQTQDEDSRPKSLHEILEDEIPREKDPDPDNFEKICRELFASGQGTSRYSLEFRMQVMRDLVLENVGVKEASKRYGMPRRTVYDWLLKWTELKAKARNEAENTGSNLDIDLLASRINRNQRRVARSNGLLTADNRRWRNQDMKNGFHNSIDVIEDKLQTWIVQQISLSLDVTERAVKHQAMKYAAEIGEPDFVPINEWCATFLSKTGLADSVTSTSDKTHTRNSTAKSVGVGAKTVPNDQVGGKRTPAFKLSVVEYAQKVGNAASARRYDISESTIRSWRKAEPKLRKEAVLEEGDDTPKKESVALRVSDEIPVDDIHDTDADFRPPRKKKKLENASKQSKTQAKSAGLFRGSALGHSTRMKIISYARRHGNKAAASFYKVSEDDVEYWLGECAGSNTIRSSQALSGPGKETIMALRRQQFRSRIANFARRKGVDAAVKNFKVSAKYIRKWMNNEFPAAKNDTDASGHLRAAVNPKSASTQTDARPNSSMQSYPIESTDAFSLSKSSLYKFQDRFPSLAASKRKYSDSTTATGDEFSSQITKYVNVCGKFSSGLEAKRDFFYLDQDYIFLNHGERGSTLVNSLELTHRCQQHIESRPQSFFRKPCSPWMKQLRKRFANFVGCEQNNLLFTDTVRSGMDTILGDLRLSQRSSIYYLSFSSDETRTAIKDICEKTGSRCQEETLLLPLQNNDDIVSVLSETLDEETTLAVFDHSPASYGFILPVKEMVLLCHMKGVPVLINGSHGFGQEPLNLSYLAPDYYVGSCDRWLCSAKGCSFVYRKKGSGDLKNREFGTETNYSSQDPRSICSRFAVFSALNFWESMDLKRICEHSHSLLRKAVQLFQSQWDADLLAPLDMNGMTCCVSLPAPLYANRREELSTISSVIEQQLYNDYKIDTAVVCIQNKLYVRISSHIYNEFCDYERLANAIAEMEADCV